MRKYLLNLCATMVTLFLMVGCAAFLENLQPARTFALTIKGEEVVITLPKDFPDMEEAIFTGEMCWDAKLCTLGFCLGILPGHGHVRFFYSSKGLVALGWCPSNVIEECKQWLYVKEVFVETSPERFNEFLDSLWKSPPGQKDVSYHGEH